MLIVLHPAMDSTDHVVEAGTAKDLGNYIVLEDEECSDSVVHP